MTRRRPGVLAAILLASAAPAARADSLRCEGGIVQAGDTKLDLLGKCGAPSLVEDGAIERSAFAASTGVGRRVRSAVEIWTYDFGRSRFLQVVRLVQGRVASVERGGYGYADAPPPRGRPGRARCEPAALSVGLLALDVLARCGEPAVRDAWDEEVAAVQQAEGTVTAASVLRTIEVWTYDFGPNQLVRLLRIEDGKVTRLETASYGYAR